jgi:cytosine/adenosine deaminase-related metal-dependent hydrolase
MQLFSLRARWILPLCGPPLEGGTVFIDGERIVAVGNEIIDDTIDLGDVVLLPGLINAHTHLEFSDCEKPLGKPGTPLPDWIRQVIGTRHRSDRDSTAAIQQGLIESLRNGVTTIGEISTCSLSAYIDFRGSQLIAFQEVIGFSAGRVDSVYADLEQRIEPAANITVTVGISPHAPYTVHPALLKQLIAAASERNLPVAMHLAESREELQLLRDGSGPFQQLLADRSMWDPQAIPRGTKPLDYLKMLARAPRALVIHGNYLDDEEIAFLAEHRDHMSVVYCPRTHAYFRHDPYPLEKMLDAGVNVVVGTDSRASNPDLSLLTELRLIAKRFPQLSPTLLLEIGTQSAARALGCDNQVGSIAAGKYADLIALPCSAGNDPFEAILVGDAQPTYVFVRGQQVLGPNETRLRFPS